MRGGQPALGPLIVLYPLGGLSRTWGPPASAKRFLCGVKQVAGDTTHQFWREQPRICGKIMEDHQEQWINLWVPKMICDSGCLGLFSGAALERTTMKPRFMKPFLFGMESFWWCKEPRGSGRKTWPSQVKDLLQTSGSSGSRSLSEVRCSWCHRGTQNQWQHWST